MTTTAFLQRAHEVSGGDYHRAKDYCVAQRAPSAGRVAMRAYNALCKAANEFRAEHTGRHLSPCRNLRWSLVGGFIYCAEIDKAEAA